MARYFIETIEEPKRYWLESHAVRGWFPDRGAASYFGEGDRKTMPLPVNGCWVIVDEPKRERASFTVIKFRPIAVRLSAPADQEYEDMNTQALEFEAALRQWIKKQQVLDDEMWSVDVLTED